MRLPECAICRKPVDLVERVNNPASWYDNEWRAYCHGRVEIVRGDYEDPEVARATRERPCFDAPNMARVLR